MEIDAWITPLSRGLIASVALAVLVVLAWWQFVRTADSDEPFDSGVD